MCDTHLLYSTGTRVALESAAKAGSVRRFVVLSSVAAG